MGNRAVIAFGTEPDATGIYLHWNGGRDSVQAFLDAAKQLGVRENDGEYQPARLCQIIGNFMSGSSLSLGVGALKTLDCNNGDNGTYVVNGEFKIVERRYHKGDEQFDKAQYEGVLAETLRKNKPLFEKGGNNV
jgi:hypothetical protein